MSLLHSITSAITTATEITCRFVPGTMDSVRVTTLAAHHDVPLKLVARLLGRPALDGLYLRGAHITKVPALSPLLPAAAINAAD